MNNANQNSTPFGFFETSSNQLQMPNEILSFSNNNAKVLSIKDAYIMKFNFPLRVNAKVVGGCTDKTGLTVYGDAYYHENLKTVVCLLGSNSLPANALPTVATFSLKGFYTPWYGLSSQ